MSYSEIEMLHESGQAEILIGFLQFLPFESFYEVNDKKTIGYIKTAEFDQSTFENQLDLLPFVITYEKRAIQDQNWNAVWESNFSPVYVDQFCQIRAEFHPHKEGFEHTIIISPQMAFGTGHHETTYMMIRAMQNLDFRSKAVWDFGTGTGILAVIAEKLGATHILATDNDPNSIENTLLHAELNGSSSIEAIEEQIPVPRLEQYEIVLANINKNVLMQYPEVIFDALKPNGVVILSGILHVHRPDIIETYSKHFTLIDKAYKGEWNALTFKKEIP